MSDKKILLVDDDEDMLMLTGRWLKKAGYEVICASSGADAIAYLKDENKDLMLLDFSMPGMDGIATLREIRNTPEISATPVIFLTGMEEEETKNAAKDLNPAGFISKSAGKQTILSALSEFFEGK